MLVCLGIVLRFEPSHCTKFNKHGLLPWKKRPSHSFSSSISKCRSVLCLILGMKFVNCCNCPVTWDASFGVARLELSRQNLTNRQVIANTMPCNIVFFTAFST